MRNIELPSKLKMTAREPQNVQWGLENGLPKVIGRSEQLLQNMFFNPSTPSRKNLELQAKSIMAARSPKMANGACKGSNPRLLGAPNPFRYISFLI